jgi:hypothetical protein
MNGATKSVRRRSVAVKKRNHVPARKATRNARKWSAGVTRNSNALDLKSRVFLYRDPEKIAASLKRSAERSERKKGTPLQSAMSMLNFYINRAGKNLTAKEKQPLEKAKEVLHALFKRKKTKQAV